MIFAGTSGMFCWDWRSDVLASVMACGDQQEEKLQPAVIDCKESSTATSATFCCNDLWMGAASRGAASG